MKGVFWKLFGRPGSGDKKNKMPMKQNAEHKVTEDTRSKEREILQKTETGKTGNEKPERIEAEQPEEIKAEIEKAEIEQPEEIKAEANKPEEIKLEAEKPEAEQPEEIKKETEKPEAEQPGEIKTEAEKANPENTEPEKVLAEEDFRLNPMRGMKLQPLDQIEGFLVRPGFYNRDGATAASNGISFTIHSFGATSCTLLLFHPQEKEPYAKLKYPESYHIGNTYSMLVFGLNMEEFEYAFRLEGPYDKEKGLLFDQKNILLDPYARAVTGQRNWGERRMKV